MKAVRERLSADERYELWCEKMMSTPGAMWFDDAIQALIKGKKLIHADGRFEYYGDYLEIHSLIKPDKLEFIKSFYKGKQRRELIIEQLEYYFNPELSEGSHNWNACGWLICDPKKDNREHEPDYENIIELGGQHFEQQAYGYLIYKLASRGYLIKLNENQSQNNNIALVSPRRKDFNISIKWSCDRNSWSIYEHEPEVGHYYAFINLLLNSSPRVFILDSHSVIKLLEDSCAKVINRNPSSKGVLRSIDCSEIFKYEGHYDILPK